MALSAVVAEREAVSSAAVVRNNGLADRAVATSGDGIVVRRDWSSAAEAAAEETETTDGLVSAPIGMVAAWWLFATDTYEHAAFPPVVQHQTARWTAE